MNREHLFQYGGKYRRLLVITGAILLLLLILYSRQIWPFSEIYQKQTTSETMENSDHLTDDTSRNTRVPVQVDTNKLQSLGIQIEVVRIDTIAETVRAVATVVPDEARVSNINTRVSGWLEKLYINKTGQTVRAGTPLAGIFSQELYASQMEYIEMLKASRSGPKSVVVESARTRLNVLGMTEVQIRELERRGAANRLTTIIAPRSGIVLELNVFAGMAVDPSLVLMTIADLSQVWILAEIPGTERIDIRIGTPVTIDISASVRQPLQSSVSFIYPALTEGTRTLRVRMVVSNQDDLLKPGAYGTAEFILRSREALTVPRDAIVDQGESKYVFVFTAPDTFVPKKVTVGVELPNRVEIISGLSKGEQIVSSGVFLIDSESRLRASGSAGGGHSGHGSSEQQPADKTPPKKTPQKPSEPESSPPGGGHQRHGG